MNTLEREKERWSFLNYGHDSNSSMRKMEGNHPGQRLGRGSVTSSDFLAAGWVRYAGATCLTRQSVNETRQVEEHKF